MQVDDQATWRRLLRATVDRATELTRKWMKENPEVPTPNTKQRAPDAGFLVKRAVVDFCERSFSRMILRSARDQSNLIPLDPEAFTYVLGIRLKNNS
jgi:hypothetical protein